MTNLINFSIIWNIIEIWFWRMGMWTAPIGKLLPFSNLIERDIGTCNGFHVFLVTAYLLLLLNYGIVLAVIVDWVRSRAVVGLREVNGRKRGLRYAQEFTITFFCLKRLLRCSSIPHKEFRCERGGSRGGSRGAVRMTITAFGTFRYLRSVFGVRFEKG